MSSHGEDEPYYVTKLSTHGGSILLSIRIKSHGIACGGVNQKLQKWTEPNVKMRKQRERTLVQNVIVGN